MKKSKLTIKCREYVTLDGIREVLVQQVSDGSIIKRFDKTPPPNDAEDVICPHFLELKWGYGCPYQCAWCYLQGTLRFLPTKTRPVVKDYSRISSHLESFFDFTGNNGYIPELLNSGELADSLMWENDENPFSEFVVPLFESQNKHKVLFLSKSENVHNLIKLDSDRLVPSFTLNASSVSKNWEKYAPSLEKRIGAAKLLSDSGYPIRIRIDPIVPIKNWENEYSNLIYDIFSKFQPERITLGSLRGLQSTINNAHDKSWIAYLSERSNWGKKINSETRTNMYYFILNYLSDAYSYNEVAFCKETKSIWRKLNKDYTKIKCNCVW